MSDKYPGFFTAIFGGRKAKEPEPVKPKKKPKKKAQKKPEPPQELPEEPSSEPMKSRDDEEYVKLNMLEEDE